MTRTGKADPPDDSVAMSRKKRRAAAKSVFAGAFLTAIKLAAGLATSSLGLLAEAAHSALDLVAAGVTWFAVRASSRPADEDHPYGHGKVENLAALGETALLALTAVWILYEAGRRVLGAGPEVEPSWWGFAVVGVSIAVDAVRSRDLRRVARESESQALEADALHFSTDIASSAVVLLGLAGVAASRHFGLPWLGLADPAAASVVAVIVLVLSWSLGRRAVDMLMDRAPAGSAGRVERAIAGLHGIAGVPGIRVRQGGDRLFAEVDVILRPGLPVAEGERLAEALKERVRAELGPRTTVTVQLRAAANCGAPLRERVSTAVAMEGFHPHNIAIRRASDGVHADFHLELPGSLTLDEGHAIADRVESRVLAEVREIARVDIHLEQHHDAPEPARALEEPKRSEVEAKIRAAAAGVPGGEVHDIVLTRTAAGLHLSCHCLVPGAASLSSAHDLTGLIERAIRAAVPELARVSVHAEPR